MEFGVFNNFWDKHPNHLPFLSLRESEDDSMEWNLQISISKLYAILISNSEKDVNEGVKRLLESEDWRPHLVASISVLSFESERRNEFIELLWTRISRGSWTSPQLLVVLSIIDNDFKNKANTIINEGFTVNYSQLTSIEHHVSRGGVSSGIASLKVVSAIQYILNKTFPESIDSHEGASIARHWDEQLHKLILEGKIQVA